MRARLLFLVASALGGALVVVTSCTDFEGTSPAPVGESDAGDEASMPVDGDGGIPAPPEELDAALIDAAIPFDAGPCGTCRSGYCNDAGGCDPLVFVTAEKYPGNLRSVDGGVRGVARGDEICTQAAGGPGVFRAWLSDTGVNAITHVTQGGVTDRPLRLVDGTIVAPSFDALIAKRAPLHAIDRTAINGQVPLLIRVWTGTINNGAATSYTCNSWSATNTYGHFGLVQASTNWTVYQARGNYQGCAATAPIYCFEVVAP